MMDEVPILITTVVGRSSAPPTSLDIFRRRGDTGTFLAPLGASAMSVSRAPAGRTCTLQHPQQRVPRLL